MGDSAAVTFFKTVEATLHPLGLMTKPYGVPKRIVLGFVLGGFITTWIKPASMFDSRGRARPWSLLQDGQQEGCAEPTLVPWYLVSFFMAFLLGSII